MRIWVALLALWLTCAAAAAPVLPGVAELAAGPEALALISAAEAQVGVTTRYDGAYVALAFPGGDIAPERGVCSDVVIRALRAGLGIDLQLAVNRDMKADFAAYPANWGLRAPDRNIDHRRVPNLEALLRRVGAELPLGSATDAFLPGDIVTSRLPGNLPHIMIVTARAGPGGVPLVAHNIGAGARVEDALLTYPLTAHFRLSSEVLARLRMLGR